MFWIDLPAGFCLLLLVILLIDFLLGKIVDRIEKCSLRRRSGKQAASFRLYQHLQTFSPAERKEILQGMPGRIRKRYARAVSIWGESKGQ